MGRGRILERDAIGRLEAGRRGYPALNAFLCSIWKAGERRALRRGYPELGAWLAKPAVPRLVKAQESGRSCVAGAGC